MCIYIVKRKCLKKLITYKADEKRINIVEKHQVGFCKS